MKLYALDGTLRFQRMGVPNGTPHFESIRNIRVSSDGLASWATAC